MSLLRFSLFPLLIALGTLIHDSSPAVQSGEILITDFAGSGAVVTVSPGNCSESVLSTDNNFQDPTALVCEESGRIFVADATAAAILEVDPTTGDQSVVHAGAPLVSPTGITTGSGDDLWVCDGSRVAILTVNKNSGFTQIVHEGPPLVSPVGIARNKFEQVYVVDRLALGGAVFRVDEGGLICISSGQRFDQPSDIAVDQGEPVFPGGDPGRIYIADRGIGGVILVDPNLPDGANQTIITQSPLIVGIPIGVTIDQLLTPTTLYVLTTSPASILGLDLNTFAILSSCALSQVGVPSGIAVCPDGPVQAAETTWGSIKANRR